MHTLLTQLLQTELDRPLSDAERAVLRESLENHDLLDDTRGGTLKPLLQQVLAAHFSTEMQAIGCGYPDGMNGLTNVFLDLQVGFPHLDWDDYGEGIRATFPRCGSLLFVNREGPLAYCVRPPSQDLGAWLREAWLRRR